MLISKKRIINDEEFKKLNLDEVKIGIQVSDNELSKLNIKQFDEGLMVEPSPNIGINCKRNARGYSYPNKELPKERRVINTLEWSWKTWDGTEHSDFFDIEREVYQKINVPASNIELKLVKNKNDEQFAIANITNRNKKYVKQTINMLLEVFGFCEIFDKDLELLSSKTKIKRCNWELLPPEVRAKVYMKKQSSNAKRKRKDFNQYRLDTLYSYEPLEVYVGTGGFTGYYAFLFNKTCYLENAIYGNATYVIPKSEWKELSQMSKNDLLATNKVIDKLNHNSEWDSKLKISMKQTENK